MCEQNQLSRSPSAVTSVTTSTSQQHLVEVSSRAAFYKKKWRGQVRYLIPIAILCALVLCLIIALISLALYDSRHEAPVQLCDSMECIRSAANLLQSMDQRADPCHDFYRFACGRWPEEHPTPETEISHDWFSEREVRVMRRIRGSLSRNASDNEPLAVTQARTFYRSCLDTEALDRMGLEPMLRTLEKLGLPRRPPVRTPTAGFNWQRAMALGQLVLNKEVMVGFGVYPDSRNKSVNRLTISSPDTASPFPGHHDMEQQIDRHRRRTHGANQDSDSPEELAFRQYVVDIMQYVHYWGTDEQPDDEMKSLFEKAAVTVSDMDILLYNISSEDVEVDPVFMMVDELQELTNSAPKKNNLSELNWREFFTFVYEDHENISLDLDGEDIIVVYNTDYLRNLSTLLSNTSSETLELVLWWDMVRVLAPTTNKELRNIKETYIQKVTNGRASESRATFCTHAVNQKMGMAVSYFIVDQGFISKTKEKVKEMLSDIKSAFRVLVDSLDWMDGATKKATLEKSSSIKSFIGFPDWLLDEEELNSYYEGLEVNEDAYLDNLLAFGKRTTEQVLGNLREINAEDSWATDPTDVNAFHTFQANAVTVPAGILQFPFYSLGLEALNYGAIGAILGHELTHGFDDTGRQYDKHGNMRQWWTNSTIEEYVNRTQCFVEQYSSYRMDEIDASVDGKRTLGENIADNGGLREAFIAYSLFRERNGPEPRLPGLEKFSHEQLFFLSFANVWCESWSRRSLQWSLQDSHAPNHVRVKGALTNSQEFSAAWGCPEGAGMNPSAARCRLW
ncbi:endothelin-converting enzyme homolog isoform X2 [Bacillus rossius redtenbacheri]